MDPILVVVIIISSSPFHLAVERRAAAGERVETAISENSFPKLRSATGRPTDRRVVAWMVEGRVVWKALSELRYFFRFATYHPALDWFFKGKFMHT